MDSISIRLLTEFKELFLGNSNVYGVHEYSKVIKKGEKEKGRSISLSGVITDELYKDHLLGNKGLGIVPIKKNNKCHFSVIDIDIYDENLNHFVSTIYKYNMPLIPFRTKSGGLHLYIFYNEQISAKTARNFMYGFVTIFGLPVKRTEVFPEQNTLKKGSFGSWINLPYYNYENTNQYMYDSKCGKISLEEALLFIKEKKQNEESLMEFFDNLPLRDGPPCLQHIYLFAETDNRNQYLFSLAVYYKAKYGDDFEQYVLDANKELNKPLQIKEIVDTILSSHKKRNYTYKCNEPPIYGVCSRKVCSNRKFGIGGDEVNQLSYGDFIQVNSDPPYYIWNVNDTPLKFYSERDIIQQLKFRVMCLRYLHVLPYKLKEITWTKIVNSALKNIVIKEVKISEDMSPGGLFKEYLYEFLETKAPAHSKEQILVDRIYKDKERKLYIFKSAKLIDFLIFQKQFRYFGTSEIQERLKNMGGHPLRYYINKKLQRIRVWALPFESMVEYAIPDKEEPIELEFKKYSEEEPY